MRRRADVDLVVATKFGRPRNESHLPVGELRELVALAGSRRRLARAAGLSEGTLSGYLRGRGVPANLARRLRRLAAEPALLERAQGPAKGASDRVRVARQGVEPTSEAGRTMLVCLRAARAARDRVEGGAK